jgi:hypothetical protein
LQQFSPSNLWQSILPKPPTYKAGTVLRIIPFPCFSNTFLLAIVLGRSLSYIIVVVPCGLLLPRFVISNRTAASIYNDGLHQIVFATHKAMMYLIGAVDNVASSILKVSLQRSCFRDLGFYVSMYSKVFNSLWMWYPWYSL